jgi:hypothetical protein
MDEGKSQPGGEASTDAKGRGNQTDVGDRAKLWKPGTVLDARFLDGPARLRARVEKLAREWFEYTDLKIEFGNVADAPLRISFKQPGSWSYLATEALDVAATQPTINFGWVDLDTDPAEVQRVVLHEFGHVLGLHHEQQNPVSAIKWNRRKVYETFTGLDARLLPGPQGLRPAVDHDVSHPQGTASVGAGDRLERQPVRRRQAVRGRPVPEAFAMIRRSRGRAG